MRLLVLGANSDIGAAIAARFAREEGADLDLASRDVTRLEAVAKDLEIRYRIGTRVWAFDAVDFASHQAFYQALDPKPDGVVVAFGELGDQLEAQADFKQARRLVETNFLGAVSILEIVAADFARRRSGFIIGLSSPAGERGRKSNYIYGAAKGALRIYLSGLGHRLFRDKVKVLTVIPGYVRTKMTAHLDLPDNLTVEPERVAVDVHRAWRRGASLVYSKGIWRWIMLAIRLLPEFVFKRTRL